MMTTSIKAKSDKSDRQKLIKLYRVITDLISEQKFPIHLSKNIPKIFNYRMLNMDTYLDFKT